MADTCASCGQPAATRCTGCIEGLDSDLQPAPTYYCCKECQKGDWKKHKALCKLKNDRRLLQRAGDLLLATFYHLRESTFDVKIDKVERVGDKLHVYEAEYEDEILVDFPSKDKFARVSDQYAVLAWCGCSDAAYVMKDLVASAVKSISIKIDEVRLFVPRSKERIVMHDRRKHIDVPHYVFRVQLKDQTSYALDLTGAQYGQYESVVPWAKYKIVLGAEEMQVLPFGASAANREADWQRLADATLQGPVSIDHTVMIPLTHNRIYVCFLSSFFSQLCSPNEDMTVASLLDGEEEESSLKFRKIAGTAIAEAKEFTKWVESCGGAHRLPENPVRMFFDTMYDLPEGGDLQAALQAAAARWESGIEGKASSDGNSIANKLSDLSVAGNDEETSEDTSKAKTTGKAKDTSKAKEKIGDEAAEFGSDAWIAAFAAGGGTVYTV